MIIRAFSFMPFEKRRALFPHDAVIGLQFQYDRYLIGHVKDYLRLYAKSPLLDHSRFMNRPGGWLPDHSAWFIEAPLWPGLKNVIEGLGYCVYEEFSDNYVSPIPDCLHILGLKIPFSLEDLKHKYRQMALITHPDRGGAHEKFLITQSAYEEARKYAE